MAKAMAVAVANPRKDGSAERKLAALGLRTVLQHLGGTAGVSTGFVAQADKR